LSDTERQWVVQKLIECPELAEELIQYETAATTIPYAAPSVPMAANLKNKLFERLELAPLDSQINSFFGFRSNELQWKPHRVPGATVAIFRRDEIKREVVGLLRAEAGVCYPIHRHATGEDIYMLKGDLIVGDETYRAGDYIHSESGSIHAPHTIGGCMFFFRTSIDDEYEDLVEAS
jgi:quercetin dioxygenase-like cupin family protein